MIQVITFLTWFLMIFNISDSSQPKKDSDDYRAVLYSIPIDFSGAHKIAPEIQSLLLVYSTTAYKYFIQYGNDTLIEILDPGIDIKPFTSCITIINYATRESSYTCIIDKSKTFYSIIDSISYSINEKRGFITKLCDTLEADIRCDSINYFQFSNKKDYQIVYKDSIANLPSIKLFYPDIKYLPYKIIGLGGNKNTMKLEEILYGKSSIDSLLHLYDYTGYKQIKNVDFRPEDIQIADDIIQRFNLKE